MNLTKVSIVVVVLLSFLTVGCHSTKVMQTTAQTDSLAIAAKKQELMDSIIREVRIRDAKRERERELDEARKKNPQNLIDSIKLGLADGMAPVGYGPSDSAWVYYTAVAKMPSVLTEVFPNVFFFEKCEVVNMPFVCHVFAVFDNHIFGPDDFNQLSEFVGSRNLDDNKRIEAYVVWQNIAKYPMVRSLSISKEEHTLTNTTIKTNYVILVDGCVEKYHYLKYENGQFLGYGKSRNGIEIY